MADVLRVQLDHVELFVPDRYEAAAWYERALGFTIVREYEAWAADPGGPLMISSDGGATKLALFEGAPSAAAGGFRRVAFRTDARGFREFLRRAGELGLADAKGNGLGAGSTADHEKAFSVYFTDPHGYRLEVTCYDYEALGTILGTLRQGAPE